MTQIVAAGFDSYREFLHEGWEPPPLDEERANVATRLSDPETTVIVACSGDAVVGHIGFVQGRARRAGDSPIAGPQPPAVPGLVHLWQLFVLPSWWGTGVADLLHRLGVEAMAAQGYDTARLFTPSAHERARRFYERRGWIAVDEQFNEHLDVEIAEYRRRL